LQILFGADKVHVKATEAQMTEYLDHLDRTEISVRLHHSLFFLLSEEQ